MKRPAVRRAGAIAGVLAILALVVAAIQSRDGIIEAWQLRRLGSADAATRDAAAAALASRGAVAALRPFLALIAKESAFDIPNVLACDEAAAASAAAAPPLDVVRAPDAAGDFSLRYGVEILCFESVSLCRRAIEIVDRAGDRAAPVLMDIARSGSRFERYLALALLGRVGPDAHAFVPEVARVLGDFEAETQDPRWRYDYRVEASETLVRILPERALHLVPDLIELTLAGDRPARVAGFKGLLRIGAPCVPQLVDALRAAGGDDARRQSILEALAHLGEAAATAVPELERLLDAEDPALRRLAINALFHLGAVAAPALPRLRQLAADEDEDETARAWARQVVEELTGGEAAQ